MAPSKKLKTPLDHSSLDISLSTTIQSNYSKFACVTKQPIISSQGLSLANEILQNISSFQEVEQSQDSVQQVPDSTTTGTVAAIIKKPRSKPKVQENLDIENLAKLGQLSKVNIATLKHWLKGKSIPFKSSEKKDALVHKTQQYLCIGVIEKT